MISSMANNKVKRLAALNKKAKLRKEEGVFIVEGEKMLFETPVTSIKEAYISETFYNNQKDLGKKNLIPILNKALKYTEVEILTDEVFQKVSDTQTPQGILCVITMPYYDFSEYLQKWKIDKENSPLILMLEDLQDPGNLGTIFRTGEGAGVSGIIMTKKTVDLFNPKTIRSTMGSIYRIPFFTVDELDTTIDILKENGITVYAARPDKRPHFLFQSLEAELAFGNMNYQKSVCTSDKSCDPCGVDRNIDYDLADYTHSTAFLIGNESNGLKKTTMDKATQYIKIPMEGKLESLNAATAAAILMYEAARQKRNKRRHKGD